MVCTPGTPLLGTTGTPTFLDPLTPVITVPASPLLTVLKEKSRPIEVGVTRFWVLFVFSLFSCCQCLVWFTFSSVNGKIIKKYYGTVDDPAIALLLNWGPIIGCLFFPFQTWLLTLQKGFR